jgi:hypothetical protein
VSLLALSHLHHINLRHIENTIDGAKNQRKMQEVRKLPKKRFRRYFSHPNSENAEDPDQFAFLASFPAGSGSSYLSHRVTRIAELPLILCQFRERHN